MTMETEPRDDDAPETDYGTDQDAEPASSPDEVTERDQAEGE
jgi:hypothetical protein